MDLKKHKISKFSPLRLDIWGGYNILSLIANSNIVTVQPLILPEFDNYVDNLYYFTSILEDAYSLAKFIESDSDAVQQAFSSVESFSISLFHLKQSINIDFSDSFVLYQKTLKTVAQFDLTFADFHCDNCKKAFVLLLDNDTSDDDFINCSDSIIHGDLHGSNLISNNGCDFKIIDFENIHFGPAYSDVLIFSMLVPRAHLYLNKILSNMRSEIKRDISFSSDLRHALSVSFIQYFRSSGDVKQIVMDSIHNTLIQLDYISSDLIN
jgi:hypothetical protein